MALQFIYGRAHSGKTQYLFENAKKLIELGKSVVIVVPEQFTHIAEKRFITKVGALRQGEAEILSFDRISKRINSEYPDTRKQLNSVGKSLIVSEILQNSELKYYTSSASKPGFVEMCVGEISEMKKYNITPDKLRETSAKIDNRMTRMKLDDLVEIYTAYENTVGSEYSDSDDSLGILCDNLNTYQPYKGYTFMFDEFSSFNPSERDVIVSLCMQCEDVLFSFCADPCLGDDSVFRPVTGTASSIERVCEQAGCTVKTPVILPDSDYANDELSHLEKNLYANAALPYSSSCKNIRIYASENPYSEVMRLASQIISLVRERKVRYRDIGVACSDIASYSHIFRSVFDQFNIPYFIDEKSRVLDHAIVNFVVNILDVYINGYNSETVVNFLKSGYVCNDKEAIYAADNFITATNATKNTWLSDERWKKTLDFYTGGNTQLSDMLSTIRNNYILPMSHFHEQIKGRNTVMHITRCLYTYLKESGFCRSIEKYIKHFREENNMAMAKQYESVWKTMIEAFDMMVYILGDKKVNVREYRMHLFTAFGQQKIGIIPTSLDEIVIGDIMRSKNEYAAYQFVVGVNDGLFPAPKSDTGMVSDVDKTLLAQNGIEYSPDLKEKAYFDRFLIYSLFTHPQNSLILSYSLSDSSFSSQRPAFVITILKNIFRDLTENSYLNDEIEIFLASEDSAREFLAMSAGALSDGRKADYRWQDVYKYFSKNSPESIAHINDLISGNKPVLKLEKELTDKLFAKEFYSTVSRIQRYNSCRYSYYLEYMLKLKEKKTYGLEASDIGTFIHEVIEKILSEIHNNNISFTHTNEKYFEAKVDVYVEEYIEHMRNSGGEVTEREIYSVKRYKAAIVASLMLIRSHFVTSAFKPIGHEIVFDDENVGCIEMMLDNGKKLKITGKIDRADSFENEDGRFIRVIDYKTGQKKFDYTDVYNGIDIQLLVYLDALVHMTEKAHHAGALYLQIKSTVVSFDSQPAGDDEIREKLARKSAMTGIIADDSHVVAAYDEITSKISNKATLQQFSMLGDYIRSGICQNANALSNGEIQINPYYKSDPDGTPDSCVYCPYKSICNLSSLDEESFRLLDKVDKKSVWGAINKSLEVNSNEVDS